MRIRKHAKLSPLWFSHASAPEDLQTHVCQLNQSPWDVIPFAQDSNQFEGEDSFTGNASLGDSIGAVESVASMMDAVAAKAEDMVVDDNDMVENEPKVFDDEFEFDKGSGRRLFCQKTDGKGWQCRNEPKDGQSFCDHHLNLLRSYNNNNHSTSSNLSTSSSLRKAPAVAAAAAAAAAAAGARRARARAKKAASSSNPYEFYYYSGFGPLWGKKRGDRGGDVNKTEPKCVENVTTTTTTSSITITTQSSPSSSSQIDNEEFDYVDDEDDEDDASGDSGKKRMRKPVKARSLKSLM